MTAKKPKVRESASSEPLWDPADASAIQSLFEGKANDVQQRRAINFIVNEVCSLPYLAYDTKSERNTTFALGKQAVGHFIIRLKRLKLGQFTGDTTRD